MFSSEIVPPTVRPAPVGKPADRVTPASPPITVQSATEPATGSAKLPCT